MSTDPRLPELFAELLEAGTAERERRLAVLRDKEPELARAVENLLAAATAGERRLASPAWRPARENGPESEPAPPERVGAFRVVREIGRGGMGRVFLAEQESESFCRKVALKLLDRPRADAATIRRFEKELRILASLEHPGIARFLDGGRDAAGTWYLALEYVEGEDLLTFAERSSLDPRRRVALFLQVLAAVDFAHRRLVVHRDLKPGNVLVGADGKARLLDFGISKVIDPETPDATRTALAALTPAYASPEQLRGERTTVGSDIYSLGVMLYELLAGSRPFAGETSPALSLAEREREPRPPSTAARQSRAGERAPREGWRELSGDLDAIILKALRSEVEDRYPSAAAFADDLERWLDGRPVEARRGGRRYRAAKFLGRNRVPATFAALAVVALVGGTLAALLQARASARERDRALEDLRRAEITNDFSAFLLSEATPAGKALSKTELMKRGEQVIDRRFAGDPELQAHMLLILSERYYESFEFEGWRRSIERAFALSRDLPDVRLRCLAACGMARAVAEKGEAERADTLLAEAFADLDEQPDSEKELAYCRLAEAELAYQRGDIPRSIRSAESALALERARSGPPGRALEILNSLAIHYAAAGRFIESDRKYEELFSLFESQGREHTQPAAISRNNWAVAMQSAGQLLRSVEESERAVALARELDSERGAPPNALWTFGSSLSIVGRHVEAVVAVDEAVAKSRPAGSPSQLFWALGTAGRVHAEAGRSEEAEALLDELDELVVAQPSFPAWQVAARDRYRAIAALELHDSGRAATLARGARDSLVAAGRPPRDLLPVLLVLARAENDRGAFEVGFVAAERALGLAGERLGDYTHSREIGVANLELARSRAGKGESAAARQAIDAALANLLPSVGENGPEYRRAAELRQRIGG